MSGSATADNTHDSVYGVTNVDRSSVRWRYNLKRRLTKKNSEATWGRPLESASGGVTSQTYVGDWG